MSEILELIRKGDPILATQIAQGQKALDALQNISASGGISAVMANDRLSLSFTKGNKARREGRIVKITDYDDTTKRYSFVDALRDVANDEFIESPASTHFDGQYRLIEINQNHSIPFDSLVVAWPLKPTDGGEQLFAFDSAARVRFGKIQTAKRDYGESVSVKMCDPTGNLLTDWPDAFDVLVHAHVGGGFAYSEFSVDKVVAFTPFDNILTGIVVGDEAYAGILIGSYNAFSSSPADVLDARSGAQQWLVEGQTAGKFGVDFKAVKDITISSPGGLMTVTYYYFRYDSEGKLDEVYEDDKTIQLPTETNSANGPDAHTHTISW